MDKYNLISNYIYFYHIDRFCVLPIYPESITDNLGSTFGQTNALSRTAPVFTYQNSGPRTVSINLSLHRDMMEDVNRNVSNLKDNVVAFTGDDYIDLLIKHLQSVALPRYRNYSSGSKSVIPPMVAVRFGNEVFVKGVVSGGINVTYKKPILSNNKYALVDVSFTVSETDPYDADSVLVDGSFRGITRSFKDGIYKSNYVGPNLTTNKGTVNTGINKPSSRNNNASVNSDGTPANSTGSKAEQKKLFGIDKFGRDKRPTGLGYAAPGKYAVHIK